MNHARFRVVEGHGGFVPPAGRSTIAVDAGKGPRSRAIPVRVPAQHRGAS